MKRALFAIVVYSAAAISGCGGGDANAGGGGKPRLTVSAAASLTNAFQEYGQGFEPATARFSFAGSDELAAQIRQGVKPDVYAAANTALPDQLFEEGLVERPLRFAGNRLVIAVSADRRDIKGVSDLGEAGIKLAVGADSVPVGQYTQQVLSRLPPGERKAIVANVRSEEPDVNGVVGKLTQGAADVGFLYVTDVTGAGKEVRAIELPEKLQPSVEYAVAVVVGAKEPDAARMFVGGLLSGRGAAVLRAAGFGRPSE